MANNDNRDSNRQAPNTLSKEKLAIYKIRGNDVLTGVRYKAFRNEKKVRDMSRMVNTYRTYVHGVVRGRNCGPMRSLAHYFCIPMSKMDSDNPRDRRASFGEAPAPTPAPVKVAVTVEAVTS